MQTSESSSDAPPLSRSQWMLLFILAAVQLAHTIDFVLIMPLAPKLRDALDISARPFGFVVSAYGWAAFASGLLLAPWLDRFDRKRSLLVLFAGFTLGTLLCALARSFPVLLLGRALAGAFGGVVAANVLAIVGDAFHDKRRGLATGVVMSAFSVSSIVGVPAGLFLAGKQPETWWVPFAVLAAASALLLVAAIWIIPPLRSHLRSSEVKKASLWEVITQPAHLKAYGVMLTLVFGGFLVFPYLVDFLVRNVGLPQNSVFMIYVFGGLATLVSMNIAGPLADRYPRLLLFRILNTSAMVPILIVTHLPAETSVVLVLLTTTCMMLLLSARMVPLTAVTTGMAPPEQRGTFLSVMASLQMLGAALGPMVAGLIMRNTTGDEPLDGYGNAGVLSVGVGLLAVALVGLLKPPATPATERVPATAPESRGSCGKSILSLYTRFSGNCCRS